MGALREDLLQGRAVALGPQASKTISEALEALGARVERLGWLGDGDDQVGEWAKLHGPLNALVYDAGPTFGAGGREAVGSTLQDAWGAIREVAVGGLVDSQQPNKIVLLGPARGAGPYAEAILSALENLARTLSVEWARYAVTAVMVAPGERADEQELAELVCFLCSTAGEYLSGCRLNLR